MMLDKSGFNRRLHALSDLLFQLFFQIGHHCKAIAGAIDYVVDSFPVVVCDNIRIRRYKLLKGEQWRGKRKHALIFLRSKGSGFNYNEYYTVEFCFVPGSESDVQALKKLP